MLSCQRLDRLSRLLVHDVDVERGGVLGSVACIGGGWVFIGPLLQGFSGYRKKLPLLHLWDFARDDDGIEPVFEQPEPQRKDIGDRWWQIFQGYCRRADFGKNPPGALLA